MEGKHLDGSRGSRLRCCEMGETGSELRALVLAVLRLLLSDSSLL